MVEEQKLEEGEGQAEAPRKEPRLVLTIVLLVIALAFAGVGYYAYTTFLQPKPAPSGPIPGETPRQATVDEAPALGVMYPLDPFIVNLSGSQGKRFLKVTISLELSALEVNAEVRENIDKIIDSILVLLSSKTFEEVYSVQGKFKLKDEVTTRVNRFLVLGHVKDAYFTEFIIQ